MLSPLSHLLIQVDYWPSSDSDTSGNVTFTVIAQHTIVGVTSISQVSPEQHALRRSHMQMTVSLHSGLMWHSAPRVDIQDLALLLPSSVTLTDGHIAMVGMQDLALLLPSVVTLTDGYIPPFALDLSAAGMHNTTTVVSDVTDGLPNGTVRCWGCQHLYWMLLPPFHKAQRPGCCFRLSTKLSVLDAASAFLQSSASRMCMGPSSIFLSLLQVYDQLQQYRALSNKRHAPQLSVSTHWVEQ